MKTLIVLHALCLVLIATTAILNAVQDKWVLTTLWSLSVLCWVAYGYKTLKMRGD